MPVQCWENATKHSSDVTRTLIQLCRWKDHNRTRVNSAFCTEEGLCTKKPFCPSQQVLKAIWSTFVFSEFYCRDSSLRGRHTQTPTWKHLAIPTRARQCPPHGYMNRKYILCWNILMLHLSCLYPLTDLPPKKTWEPPSFNPSFPTDSVKVLLCLFFPCHNFTVPSSSCSEGTLNTQEWGFWGCFGEKERGISFSLQFA